MAKKYNFSFELFSDGRADFMRYTGEIPLHRSELKSVQGVSLLPGQKLTRIGKMKRSMFLLKPEFFMTFEGIFERDRKHMYAIFICPAHNSTDASVKYAYAFPCVFDDNGLLQCFVLGKGGPLGCYDVVMDDVGGLTSVPD